MKLQHEAYTEEKCLGDSTILYGHKAFSKGRETTALLPYVEQPLSICAEVTVNTITVVVQEDCHITVQQLAQALHISKLSVHKILCEKWKMWRVTACWVPYFLTRKQEVNWIEICRKWVKKIEEALDVMGRTIIGDENWIHHFDPTMKQESMLWKSPQFPVKKKVHRAKSMKKVTLILFFDAQGTVYQHIVPHHTTINAL